MMKCTIKSCNEKTQQGDILFCKHHRYQWRGFLKLTGVEFIELSEEEVNKLLADFKVSYMAV